MVLQQAPKFTPETITNELSNELVAPVITTSQPSKPPTKKEKKLKFGFKQLPFIVFGLALVGIGGLAFSYYQTGKQAELRAFRDDLASQSKIVDNEFALAKDATVSLSAAARSIYDLGLRTPEAYNRLSLEFYLKRGKLVMAHSIGQAPFKLVPTTKWFWGYYYTDQGKKEQTGIRLAPPNDKTIYSELFKDDDYPSKNYYNEPMNAGKSVWTAPYLWYGINITSYLHIFRDAKGDILGIANADLNITAMVDFLKSLKSFNTSSFYSMITDKGIIIAYPPDPQQSVERANVDKVAELKNIWEQIQKDKQGYVVADGKIWTYRRLPVSDWFMLQTVTEGSLYGGLLVQTLATSGLAVLFLSVIFALYLRTLNQSSSLANLLTIQEKITDRQKSEANLAEIQGQISRLQTMEGLTGSLIEYLAEIRKWLDCDRAVIYEFDDKFAGRITHEDVASGWTSAFAARLSDPCIPQTLIDNYLQGRVVATNDVLNAGFAPEHLSLMHKLQIKSNLVVPIRQADELYGLLIVHKCETQHVWQESEINYLRQAGEQLGYALSGIQLALQKQNTVEQERLRSENIQRELITLLSDVEGAASGDLTVRAQISSGEIGIVADFFNAIVESLRDVVTQVKQASSRVNTSVNTNNESIRNLAKNATLQADQLDDALQSVAQMTDSMQLVAVSAQQAADASSNAADTAEAGSVEIEQSVQSIMKLSQTVDDTAKKVKRLGDASQQISKVVVLIDQIALKTNMLALNASVEAARAGEEGRGFAVVAAEVGALAAQSANATREIGRLVETIQQETSEVVESMQASTLQVVEGTSRVENARKSLNQIVEVSRKVNALFQNISLATTSQVKTSESVRSLMSTLSTQSQQSSDTSRDVAIALQETADIASQLQSSVETFKVN